MEISVNAQDFELTHAIDEYLREQLQSAFARISEHVTAVEVFLKDANGPRGGVDKQVLISVRSRNRRRIVLLTKDRDLYVAIARGVKRTKRALRRQLRRTRRFGKLRLRDLPRDPGLATVSGS